MNEAGLEPDFLSATDLETVRSADELLLSNPQLRKAITYRRHTGSSYDPETGEENPSEKTTELDVLAGRVRAREVRRSGGLFEVGDHKFLIRKGELKGRPPTKDDEIDLSNGTRLEVVFWQEDPMDSLYLVAAREA